MPPVRRAFAPLLCLTLALPLAAPLPARAGPDAEDVAKILGGLAIAYVVGREIRRRQDEARDARAPVIPAAPAPAVRTAPRTAPLPPPVAASPLPRQRPAPAAAPPRAERLLPEQCWTVVEGPVERRAGYGASCTRNAVARPGSLPARCVETVGTARGVRELYGAACMMEEGWQTRLARR
jgi:hypothetical protein